MFGGDNPENYKNGVKTIRYTIYGLVVVILSFSLVKILQQLLQ